ncbi:hypothetical protein ACFVUN_03545 [Kitasatospora griseola]|uniref:hypothetical protein n=1 Tax=Kitasatospora griseola TaxID=2064 RepID=UPI0036DCB738
MTDANQPWIHEYLPPDDLRTLDGVVVHLSGQRSITLPHLLDSWKDHVGKLEADLSLTSSNRSAWGAYDLVAALVLRDFIHEKLGTLDATLRSRVEPLLSEIDIRFKSFTEPDDQLRVEMLDARPGSEREWWWKRIPVTGPAREDVILLTGLN